MTPTETESIPDGDPFALFDNWFTAARLAEPNDPNAMALATATADGRPSLRMVLLKDHGAHLGQGGGFVFYTNFASRKGAELAANPRAALLFHWKSLRRQVRIEGVVSEVSAPEADAYFASRGRESQLASAASDQSRSLADRADYLARVEALRAQVGDAPVPRPPHWSGYRLIPESIEFWLDRPHRLHERRRFERGEDGRWTSGLLYP